MQEHDFTKFSEIIFFMADNFSVNLKDGAVSMRFEALKEYSIEQIQKAATSIVKTRKYTKMPTIADFIDHIDGSSEDRAAIGALKVWNAIGRVGNYETVVFDDPVTMAVIEQYFQGWIKLCEMPEKDKPWFMRDFEKTYKSFKSAGIKKYGKLIGTSEADNAERGYIDHIPEPKLIGDKKVAEVVLIGNAKYKEITENIG